MQEINIDKLTEWISYLRSCKIEADIKRDHLLQVAFSRDKKPDEETYSRYKNKVKCSSELIEMLRELKQYLRRKEREEKNKQEQAKCLVDEANNINIHENTNVLQIEEILCCNGDYDSNNNTDSKEYG